MGFFDVLAVLIIFGFPSVAYVLAVRAKEKRLERTNPEMLQYQHALRRLEMEHEAKVLSLPAGQGHD